MPGNARRVLLTLVAVLALIPGCANKTGEAVPRPFPHCETLYTLAPGFLVVELAAGSDIFLEPAAQTFHVYCSARDAWDDLALRMGSGRLPRGDWQVYALDGGSEKLACVQNGELLLCRPAKIVEWAPREAQTPAQTSS